MTVLCVLGEWEVEGVGGGRSGEVSVEVEAIAGLKGFFLIRLRYILSYRSRILINIVIF